MSNSLWPHGLLHTRPSCPSPSPEICPSYVHCIHGAIQPSHPLTPSSPSALNLSHQGLFQWVSCSHYMIKILEFPLQHQSFQWVLRVDLSSDWLTWSAVQRTLRSLLQHHSLKAASFWRSTFFMVQPSQASVTTGKTIVLTIRTFVGRVVCLLFNTLSRFVIVYTQWLYVYWMCICMYVYIVIFVYMNIKIITVEVFIYDW